MLVSLRDILQKALKYNYAVAGLVTLGWEDMMAYIEAAEQEKLSLQKKQRSCQSNIEFIL